MHVWPEASHLRAPTLRASILRAPNPLAHHPWGPQPSGFPPFLATHTPSTTQPHNKPHRHTIPHASLPQPTLWNTAGTRAGGKRFFSSVVHGRVFSSGNKVFFEVGPMMAGDPTHEKSGRSKEHRALLSGGESCNAHKTHRRCSWSLQSTRAVHATFCHKIRRVPLEWEETLCLDGAAVAQHHPRHHRVAERRRWAWVGVVTGTRETQCASFLIFIHEHEAITTPSPIPGQVALRQESGYSPRKALPGLRCIELFGVFHFIVELSVGAVACLSSQVRALHASWHDT